MKTTAKQFTGYGNTALVQIRTEPEATFPFMAGGPEMKSGGLLITEASPGGVVSKLLARNKTDAYLLLTDADVLVGAKQNRVLNRSVLIAPGSETIIDVSCIERLRWQYNSRRFSSPGTAADPSLRKAKAPTIKRSTASRSGFSGSIQQDVWQHINFRLNAESFSDKTESYHELMSYHRKSKSEKLPACEPEKGCNGIAIVSEGKVQCIDLFGTEAVYRYYFPLLRDSAFLTARTGKEISHPDIHEACFRVLDTLDGCETASRIPEEGYTAAGQLEVLENSSMSGYSLGIENQLIHRVIFSK